MNARARIVTVLLAAVGGAGAMWNVPVPVLEWAMASAGVSELVPAAAPPLGTTARLVLAGVAGVFGVGVAAAVMPSRRANASETDSGAQSSPQQQGNMGIMASALSRLADFARGRGRSRKGDAGAEVAPAAPSLRKADAHPDAPARAPIIASRDLGQAVTDPEPVRRRTFGPQAAAQAATEAPHTPSEAGWDDVKAEMADLRARVVPAPTMAEPFLEPVAPVPTAVPTPPLPVSPPQSCAHLSITQLADRFEAGMARLSHAPVPASSPFAHVPKGQEMDAALSDALAALRAITARSR